MGLRAGWQLGGVLYIRQVFLFQLDAGLKFTSQSVYDHEFHYLAQSSYVLRSIARQHVYNTLQYANSSARQNYIISIVSSFPIVW